MRLIVGRDRARPILGIREISRAEIDSTIEAHSGWPAALVPNIELLSR